MPFTQKSPLVSVIIPFFNEERFLQEAIDSVIQQSFTSWELLLVDDGSNDKSSQIAMEYAKKFTQKIRYFEHKAHINKGLSASRNLGIRNTVGTFVAFLDADDIWLPQKLQNQVSIFSQNPKITMIMESSLYWFSWNNRLLNDMKIPVGANPNKAYDPPELMLQLYPLGKGAAPCPSGLIVHKEVFSRTGFFEESFTKDYQLYEDQAFLSKIYLNEKVYVSSACNNWYRQRKSSIVFQVKAKGKYHFVRQYYLEWLCTYTKQMDKKNTHLQKVINKSLLPYHYPAIYFVTVTMPKKALKAVKIPYNIFSLFLKKIK